MPSTFQAVYQLLLLIFFLASTPFSIVCQASQQNIASSAGEEATQRADSNQETIQELAQPQTDELAQKKEKSSSTQNKSNLEKNQPSKNDFKPIGVALKHVSTASNSLIVGINEQGAVQFDGTTWKSLDKKDLKQIEIAGDGTIWGVDTKKQAWRKDEKGWALMPGSQLDSLTIGNKHEVWGILKSTVYRKIDPAGITPAWRSFPGQALDIAAGGDGAVWVIGAQDATLYRLYRPAARWEVIIKPGNMALGAPQQIRVADQFNVAFLDFQGKIWKLIPGKKGTASADWRMVSNQTFTTFSLGYDGIIIGITSQGDALKYDPSNEEKEALEQARGQEVQATDVVTITSLWDGRQVWTQGTSFYDPQGTNPAPNNHLELLVGPTNDARQFIGGFFMLTPAQDTQQREPIKFGDEVEIYSLYAVPGLKNKSGILGKEWKWWVHNPHAQLGKSWCDLAVSLLKYPEAQSGAQRFKIESPYGQTGVVRKNDAVQITSQQHKRNIFVRQESRFGQSFYELTAPAAQTTDTQAISKEIFGSGEYSGAHLFSIQPVIADQVPKVARAAYLQIMGKPVEPTGKQETLKKKILQPKLGNGIGIISKITNLTAAPLETSVGEIKGGVGKFLGKTGVEGVIHKQIARVTMPDLLGATLEKSFWLSGIAQEIVANSFESGTLVKLKKLWSKGIAWINESLGTPGSTTVIFFARAQDEGNIQVCFGQTISPKDIFRVIIGGWKNSKTAIVANDNIIAQVKADVNPFAKAQPGQVLPYWVSMYNNFVIVGAGTPGTNIILASYVPYTQQPTRIGFSSHEQPVDYTEIIVGNPLILQPTGSLYKQNSESVSVAAQQGNIAWAQTPLRVFNTGTISFQTTAPHTVTLVLDNNQQEQYRIEFGADSNKSAYIVKNGQTVQTVSLDTLQFAQLSSGKPTTFWVSIEGGRIIVGQGDVGKNAFMLWEDPSPIRDVVRIGFVGTTFAQEITNISQAPPVALQELKPKFEYKRQVRPVRQFKGPMVLVKPFEYQLVQDGPRVVFKDMDDETSSLVPVLSTPMQNGRYPFTITIAANGKPEIQGTAPTDAPAKLALELTAKAINAAGDAAFMYAPMIGKAAKDSDVIRAIPMIGESAAIIKNIAAVAATTAVASAGVAAKIAAATANAAVEHGFRSHDSYVKTEEVKADQSGTSQIPKQAIRNEAAVSQLLQDIQELKPSVQQDFEQLVAQYQEIMRRINHPYVVQKITTKTSIASGITSLSQAYKSYSGELALQFLNLLLSAVTNPYLKTMTEVAQWSRTMSEILRERLLKAPEQELELPALKGEYIWLPFEFAKQDHGGISFEVKARSDVFVCFSQDQFTSKSINNQVYEVLLGGWNNNRHEIHIQSLGRAAAALNREQNAQAMLSPIKFTKYSITLNQGLLKIFLGDPETKSILEWKDPFPWLGIDCIGLSSWDTPITLRAIKLLTEQGTAAQETSKQQKEKAAAQKIKERQTFTEETKDWEKEMKYRPVLQYQLPQGQIPYSPTSLPPLKQTVPAKK